MQKRAIALLLTLMTCLAMLSACGTGGETDTNAPAPPATESQQSQPVQPAETDEPKAEEQQPEEVPQPEELAGLEPQDHAGTQFLALLQEEYRNGFVEGERPGCTYYANNKAFIYNGAVYIRGNSALTFYSYDLVTKELREAVSVNGKGTSGFDFYFMDGNFYFVNGVFDGNSFRVSNVETRMYGNDGLINSFEHDAREYRTIPFEKGILEQFSK